MVHTDRKMSSKLLYTKVYIHVNVGCMFLKSMRYFLKKMKNENAVIIHLTRFHMGILKCSSFFHTKLSIGFKIFNMRSSDAKKCV